MDVAALRELGTDFLESRQPAKAFAVFAEAVRRQPADHRSRMWAGACLHQLDEPDAASRVLQVCAEGLLKRDYLLSAIAACKLGLSHLPDDRRLLDTLMRIHARASRSTADRAAVPPPLPPEPPRSEQVEEDLMTLREPLLRRRALEVLGATDPGEAADPLARPPLPLFADLERDAFVALVLAMGFGRDRAGATLAREGEGGEVIVVLVAGKAEVSRRVQGRLEVLGYLGGGSIFGELSMMTHTPPTATVQATSEVEQFVIAREHLNDLAKRFPAVPDVLAGFARQRMARNLVTSSSLFQQVPEGRRAELLARFGFRALGPGEAAMRENEHAPGLYVVLAGELMVEKSDPSGGKVSLGVLHEGELVGEISLLTQMPASATVIATRKTACAYLDPQAFSQLLQAHPETRRYLEALGERRLKQIGHALRPQEIIDADPLVVGSP